MASQNTPLLPHLPPNKSLPIGHLLWKCQDCWHVQHDFICVIFLSPLLAHELFDPCVIFRPPVISLVPDSETLDAWYLLNECLIGTSFFHPSFYLRRLFAVLGWKLDCLTATIFLNLRLCSVPVFWQGKSSPKSWIKIYNYRLLS